ncbi:MAG: NIPSNAP family protein [Rhizobiaceae bacterium]|nr:NIPSNAP family protein [Rhizobiaceae bacterium]
MSYYELATLKIALGGMANATSGLQQWLGAQEAVGRLLGAWSTDIGPLNEIILLREFATLESLMSERERLFRADDTFDCHNSLVTYRVETFRPLDFITSVETGNHGPYYEIRSYRMKLNGLIPTTEKWQAALPKRSAYSPCTIALYGIEGTPRLTQIWPYTSLAARAEARAQSVKDGVWPPIGGPDWLLEDMVSVIALPLPFSPLQ